MDVKAKKRKYERLHCDHCNTKVSKSTWYVHYQKYFDSVSGTWKKEGTSQRTPPPDFNFQLGSSESSSESEKGLESDGDFSFEDEQNIAVADVSCCKFMPVILLCIINPRRACTARVTLLGAVCVCVFLSVKSNLTSGVSICPENTVTHSAGNGG